MGRFNTFFTDYHCAIMQRAVFKENVLNQPLVNIGIDNFTGTNDIVKRYITLHNNQSSYFLLSHTDASHHNRHDIIMLEFFFLLPVRKRTKALACWCEPRVSKKAPDFILKQNNQRQDSHTHQFVENGAQGFISSTCDTTSQIRINTGIPVNTLIDPEAFISL